MQVQVIQQANNQHIQSINQAVLTMQKMSDDKQKKVFEYIELLCFYDGIGLVNEVKEQQEKSQDNKQIMGDTLVELFADVSMTDEEVAFFDEIRKDDDSEVVKFD